MDFDELEQKLNILEKDCRAAFDYLRAISKHETPQVKTKYVWSFPAIHQAQLFEMNVNRYLP